MDEWMHTYIHIYIHSWYNCTNLFYVCGVTKTYKKGLWVKKQNGDDLMVLTYLALLAHNSSEGFKKTQLLMYRTFELLREHGGTGKLFILLVFLICVITLLLTEPEDEFLSELLISSFWNSKSPSSGKRSLSSSPISLHLFPRGFSISTSLYKHSLIL